MNLRECGTYKRCKEKNMHMRKSAISPTNPADHLADTMPKAQAMQNTACLGSRPLPARDAPSASPAVRHKAFENILPAGLPYVFQSKRVKPASFL